MKPGSQPPKFQFINFIHNNLNSEVQALPTNTAGEVKATIQIEGPQTSRLSGLLRHINATYPSLWRVSLGLGGALLLAGLYKTQQISKAEAEINFRKEQLQKPVYELQGNEVNHFPWNKDNLNEWLYRPVRVTGREIHNKAVLLHRKMEGYHGFEYFVPVVTKENEESTYREGIFVNKGWMPHEYYHVASRFRIENSFHPETHTCYVSDGGRYSYKQSFFKEGNNATSSYQWGNIYLPDMVKFAELMNVNDAKVACLEAVDLKTPLDERDPVLFKKSLSVEEDYPYPKTLSGALNLPKMPWHLRHERSDCFLYGGLATLFGAALRAAV